MPEPDLLGPVIARLRMAYNEGAVAHNEREVLRIVAKALQEAIEEPIQ